MPGKNHETNILTRSCMWLNVLKDLQYFSKALWWIFWYLSLSFHIVETCKNYIWKAGYESELQSKYVLSFSIRKSQSLSEVLNSKQTCLTCTFPKLFTCSWKLVHPLLDFHVLSLVPTCLNSSLSPSQPQLLMGQDPPQAVHRSGCQASKRRGSVEYRSCSAGPRAQTRGKVCACASTQVPVTSGKDERSYWQLNFPQFSLHWESHILGIHVQFQLTAGSGRFHLKTTQCTYIVLKRLGNCWVSLLGGLWMDISWYIYQSNPMDCGVFGRLARIREQDRGQDSSTHCSTVMRFARSQPIL